ncbi:7TM-DISM receptor extracellular domain-containing protein [Sphingobacterium prati]
MWKHLIFLITVLFVSFKNLNANSIVLKSDSFQSACFSSKTDPNIANILPSTLHQINNSDLDPLYPVLQSIAELDVENNQDWLTDRWVIMVNLLWHELQPSALQNDYCYQHILDIEPIPIARFLLFEQIKIPF